MKSQLSLIQNWRNSSIRFIARMPALEVVALLPQFGKSLLPVNPWITPFTRKKP